MINTQCRQMIQQLDQQDRGPRDTQRVSERGERPENRAKTGERWLASEKTRALQIVEGVGARGLIWAPYRVLCTGKRPTSKQKSEGEFSSPEGCGWLRKTAEVWVSRDTIALFGGRGHISVTLVMLPPVQSVCGSANSHCLHWGPLLSGFEPPLHPCRSWSH